jgi:hypothetical protein
MKPLHKNLLIIIIALITFLVGYITFAKYQNFSNLSGSLQTKERTPAKLSELSIGGPFTVSLTQNGTNHIKITTDKNLANCAKVNANDTQVDISRKRHCALFSFIRTPIINVEVSFDQLKKLQLGGTSTSHTTNDIVFSDSLELEILGASDAKLSITVPTLKGEISGTSDLTLTSLSDSIDLEVSGTSTLKTNTLSRQLSVELAGTSEAIAQGSTTLLDVQANGASTFKGEALKAEKADLEANGVSEIIVNATTITSQTSGVSNVRNKK